MKVDHIENFHASLRDFIAATRAAIEAYEEDLDRMRAFLAECDRMLGGAAEAEARSIAARFAPVQVQGGTAGGRRSLADKAS